MDVATQSSQSHMKLNSINLRGFHDVQDKVMLLPFIHLTSPTDIVYHTTIRFYGALSSTLVLVIVILVRRYRLKNLMESPETKMKDPEPNYADKPNP